nr:chloride channel protein [Alsobacter ponti]
MGQRLGRSWLLAPPSARAFVRASELGLVGVAALVGLASGAAVSGIAWLTQSMHEVFFGLPLGERLSSVGSLRYWAAFLLPAVGGGVLALWLALTARWTQRHPADPIEANALHGGRMSLVDSVQVTVQNVISNGFGASVGLEAGYTQICAALASRLGRSLELRRADLRTLVGCGAAGAIASAFNGPLTGAFYAFELIVGVYSIGTLTPVIVASLAATFVSRALLGHSHLIAVVEPGAIANTQVAVVAGLGLVSAAFGIALMWAVTGVERTFRVLPLPPLARPALGGLGVGLFALVSPQVLSAGHGAFQATLAQNSTLTALGGLIALKALAAAISLGSGFRGGLFFAALFLGALLGKLAALLIPAGLLGGMDGSVLAMVGMSSLAVAIVGGPLTMTFLALEMTGDFQITVLVLVAVIVASTTVRKLFGYSFATWRFHLRGESIRSAHDVGWLRSLTVGKLMRRDVRTVRADSTVAMLRRDFPPGSTQRLIVVDNADRYAGILLVPDLHASSLDDKGDTKVGELMRYTKVALDPAMNVKEAMEAFDSAESEELAVVNRADGKVLGLLTESHALKRYSAELDRHRRDILGEL